VKGSRSWVATGSRMQWRLYPPQILNAESCRGTQYSCEGWRFHRGDHSRLFKQSSSS
jgi:hypothetical protein